ncbi:PepSY-associated TM helix domain-containing protein [candidate division KSB1 bacterium]|nr:PepSY-associated TM helix domain-containing protein [candidate division KSB1 bacterium]
MTTRKLFRILHRDLGYIFFGMTIIYSVTGIAINHINDWNPNYIITSNRISVNKEIIVLSTSMSENEIKNILEETGEKKNYKSYYFPDKKSLKIFIKGGSLFIDLDTGEGYLEKIKRRPVLRELNFLHYNPAFAWTIFSDIFAISLIIISFTGLFLIKGEKGITGRGAWLTATGIIIPIIYIFILF